MSLTTITLILAALGVVWTSVLAIVFLRDTDKGMDMTAHVTEDMPKVLRNHYVPFAVMAFGATLYGDLLVIAGLFAAFSYMGFADVYTYKKVGKPIAKHMSAGISGAIVVVFALLALKSTGVSA